MSELYSTDLITQAARRHFVGADLSATQYAVDRAAPILPVTEPAGIVSVLDPRSFVNSTGDTNTSEGGIRTPTAKVQRLDLSFSSVAYQCKPWAFETPVSAEGTTVPAPAKHMSAALTLKRELWAYKEALFASKAFASSVQSVSATAAWNTSSAKIVKDIRAAAAKIGKVGAVANALIISRPVLDIMMQSDEILNRFSGVVIATYDLVVQNAAALFGLKYVIVSDAVKATTRAPKTLDTAHIVPTDQALVAVVPDDPADETAPAFARTFVVSDYDQDGNAVPNVEYSVYYEPQTRSFVHQAAMTLDVVIGAPHLACRITGVQ